METIFYKYIKPVPPLLSSHTTIFLPSMDVKILSCHLATQWPDFLSLCTIKLNSVFAMVAVRVQIRCIFSAPRRECGKLVDALDPVKLASACGCDRLNASECHPGKPQPCWCERTHHRRGARAGGWTHFSLTASPLTRIIHYWARICYLRVRARHDD
jgi:hypothetical protein